MTSTSLTIGRLAKQTHVNVETIRYYQRVGLIQEPEKPDEGFRVYPHEYISRVNFIKRAQELGFSLKEIQGLLDLGDGNCQQVQQLAEQKLEQIEARLNDLKSIKKALADLVDQCNANNKNPCCALIDALNKPG